jgi:hypothetical protein
MQGSYTHHQTQVDDQLGQNVWPQLLNVHFGHYDQTYGGKNVFGFSRNSHLNKLFRVWSWNKFKGNFGCYLHPTENKDVFGDGNCSLHFYKKVIAQPYKLGVWS